MSLVIVISRSVNPCLQKFKLKYESLPTFAEMFEKEFWFFTFDLESGYHHIDIDPEFWKYLGFAWIYPDGQRRYFAFKGLPFGLSLACYLFTKMFRPLVARWREKGIASIMYIDDGIAGNSLKERAINASKLVRKDLM